MIRDYILSKYSGSPCKWKPLGPLDLYSRQPLKNPVQLPYKFSIFKFPYAAADAFRKSHSPLNLVFP